MHFTYTLEGIPMKKLLLSVFITIMSYYSFSQKDSIFWFATPSLSTISSYQYDRPTFFRFSTFSQAATITISMPANFGFTPINMSVAANSHYSIDMTPYIDQIESQPSNTVLNKGLLIQSTSKITAYYEAEGESHANPDIFTLKGKNSLGKLFYIPFQNYSRNCDTDFGCERSSFDIIASEDSTTVNIIPTNNIDGHLANIPFSVVLNKGQAYSAKATGRLAADHLGGSKVFSNKPISITMKDDMTNNFTNGYCQDLIGDQMIPVEKLGTDYIIVKGDLNIDDRFYVCATQPNTTISVDNIAVSTINDGQMYSGSFSGNTAYITSSAPICVLHTTGYGCKMGGAYIPPLTCTGSKEIVLSRTTNDAFSLMLIVKATGISNFTLNNNATLIPSSSFNPVNGTSNTWYYAKITYSSSTLPANSFIRVKNSTSNFHLALINGQSSVTGCRYGFFTEFNKTELSASTNHAPTNQFCIGDTVRLSADSVEESTATTYIWSGPNGYSATGQYPYFIATSNQNSGVYTVNATTNSCPTEPLSLNLSIGSPSINLPPDTTICSNTPITLTPTGNFTSLLWSTGATTPSITINTSGTYWVKGFSGFSGCYTTDTINIIINQLEHFSFGSDKILCNATQYTLTAPFGSYTYLWSDGSANSTLTVHQSGIYWLEIDNSSICPYRDTIQITFNNPSVSLPSDTTICYNTSVTLTPIGNFTSLLWSTGATTPSITVNTSGTYWVKGFLGNNCFASDSMHITVLPSGQFSLGNDTTICDTSHIVLTAPSGGYTLLWSTGSISNSVNVQQTGLYWLEIDNDSICPFRDSINIAFVPIPTPNLGADITLCYGSSLLLNDGLNSGTSIWSTGEVGHSITINTSGTYWVVSSSAANCNNSDTIVVVTVQPTAFSLVLDTTLCENQIMLLNAGSGFDYYIWNTGDTTSSITISQPGNYSVIVTEGPCKISTSINILPCPCIVSATNVFTPNNDGFNDYYQISASNISYLNMQIFNRWGELLYEQTDLNAKWDGRYKGKMCPEGAYFCVFKYKCDFTYDKLYQSHTSVTLIK